MKEMAQTRLSTMAMAFIASVSMGFARGQSITWNLAPGPTNSIFTDDFEGKLAPGWFWLREHKQAWRGTQHGLEVLIEPGNMWGPQNDAKNLLLRAAPEIGSSMLDIGVTFEHFPTNQYEQADLVWYLDDSNMVKLGEELVDGQLSVVMGREENDQTRTISITPLRSNKVLLRMYVAKSGVIGMFQLPGTDQWNTVGHCPLPKSGNTNASGRICFQFYQGTIGSEHWARATKFYVAVRKQAPLPEGK